MKYQILASDYDNTLVPFGEPYPRKRVAEAVKRMQAAGGRFVLCTGRSPSGLKRGRLGEIRYDYALCSNGAYVMDRAGKCVSTHPLTNEEMYALVDYCEDYSFPLQFAFSDGDYAYVEYEVLREFYARMAASGLSVMDGEDRDHHLIEMPFSAFALMTREGYAGFQAKYGYLGLALMRVGRERPDGLECYDVARRDMNKGVGLADLCRTLDIPLEQTVAAGDSDNDIPLLQTAGLSCAMANGNENSKAAAHRVIGDVRADGLADLIEELWFDGPRAEAGRPIADAWDVMDKAGAAT